jgi:hypothetical protein
MPPSCKERVPSGDNGYCSIERFFPLFLLTYITSVKYCRLSLQLILVADRLVILKRLLSEFGQDIIIKEWSVVIEQIGIDKDIVCGWNGRVGGRAIICYGAYLPKVIKAGPIETDKDPVDEFPKLQNIGLCHCRWQYWSEVGKACLVEVNVSRREEADREALILTSVSEIEGPTPDSRAVDTIVVFTLRTASLGDIHGW